MRALIATLLLFIASPVLAFQGMGPGPGVKGYVGGGGSMLAGDKLTVTNYEDPDSAAGAVFDGPYTASSSGTLVKGFFNLRAVVAGRYCKMVVWGSTGTIIAVSNAVEVPTTEADVQFTFSSGSITASSNYYLGKVCDSYVQMGTDYASYASGHQANSYASPTDLTAPNSTNANVGSFRIWVEN